MKGMPGRMSHPKDTVEVGGVGSLSQEWRDHPESSEASPKPWNPETKTGTSQDSRREGSMGGHLGRQSY